MPFYAKLAAFWVIVYGALWLLSQFPQSRIARIAFAWYGPVPQPGEYKSAFLARWCSYSLRWFAQLVFVLAVGHLISIWFPAVTQTTIFLAVWAFALPLLCGMALLGAAGAAGASLKAKYLGPNPAVELASHEPRA